MGKQKKLFGNRWPTIHRAGIMASAWEIGNILRGLGSGGFSPPVKLNPDKKGTKGQLYNLAEDAKESRKLIFPASGKSG